MSEWITVERCWFYDTAIGFTCPICCYESVYTAYYDDQHCGRCNAEIVIEFSLSAKVKKNE